MGLVLSECQIFVPFLRTNKLGKQNVSTFTKFHYVVMQCLKNNTDITLYLLRVRALPFTVQDRNYKKTLFLT